MFPTPWISERRRRRFLASALALGGGALLFPAGLFAQERSLRPTPPMTLGPFYPDVMPPERDADLTTLAGRPRAAGQLLYVSGRVLDTRGRPIAGAYLELWQANVHGRYIHSADSDASGPLDPGFQGYGALKAGADGSYRVKTIRQPLPKIPHRTRRFRQRDVGLGWCEVRRTSSRRMGSIEAAGLPRGAGIPAGRRPTGGHRDDAESHFLTRRNNNALIPRRKHTPCLG